MTNRTILFIQIGSFSHINKAFFQSLEKKFPDYNIECLDLKILVKQMSFKDKLGFAIKSLFSSKKIIRNDFRGLNQKRSHFFKLSNRLILKATQKKVYVFSIQTQSNFNGNLGYCPHYIYTDHTHLVNLSYPGFDTRILNSKNWVEQETKLYKNATGIFTMSNHVKNSLRDQYHIQSDKVKCVYAGSNISYSDIFYPLDRYSNKNILFVGVDWERKGGPELFEAFKLVYQKHPDVKLDIVGCSPEIQHPNVKIWGKLPLDQVKKHYETASIFCMPSKREPFGIVYLEAMAYKLPIVGLNIGALPDFVEEGKNGFLLDYKDIQGMASQLIYLLDNPKLCKKMGEYGYLKMEKQYQWKKSVTSIREFIENQGVLEKLR